MAKKGSGKGKKGASKKDLKARKVTDGLHRSEMSKAQLCAHIKLLMAEKDRELEESNLFLLEKHKLNAMWSLAMEKLIELKQETSHSQSQTDQAQKDKDKESSIQNSQLRHIQAEEIKNFGIIRLNHLLQMRQVSNEVWGIEVILRESSMAKRRQVRKHMHAFYEVIRGMHTSHLLAEQNMLITMTKSMRDQESLQSRLFEERTDSQTDEGQILNPRIFQLKINNLQNLDQNHDKILQDLKTYFNDMTVNNFAFMTTLQAEIDRQKIESDGYCRALAGAKSAYLFVSKKLLKLQEEYKEIQTENKDLTKMAHRNHNFCLKLRDKKKCVENLKMLNQILRQRIRIAEKNKKSVEKEFVKEILNFQKQMSMDHLITELKAKAAKNETKLLKALNSCKIKDDDQPLKKLHGAAETSQFLISQKIQTMNKEKETSRRRMMETSCVNAPLLTEDFRQKGAGLINRQGAYFPTKLHSNININNRGRGQNQNYTDKFKGVAQRINTNIEFKSLPYININLNDNRPKTFSESSNPNFNFNSKDVGYGFYYNQPDNFLSRKRQEFTYRQKQNFTLPPISDKGPLYKNAHTDMNQSSSEECIPQTLTVNLDNRFGKMQMDPSKASSSNLLPSQRYTEMMLIQTPMKIKNILKKYRPVTQLASQE